MDSITLAKSSVRGGRDGRLRSAATTKSSPLRFCPFGLEDSALSFLWFWRGRSLFSAATASSWLAYRLIPNPCPERGHDDWVAGARDGVLLLHEPPNVVPEGFVFLLCDLIEIPLNPGFVNVPWKLSMNLAQRSPQELIEFTGSPVSQSCTVGDRPTGK